MRSYILVFVLAFSANVKADDVSMAFGEKIPPFCFPETNSGIEVEVIREALAVKGHTLVPRYYPFARVPIAFQKKEVYSAMTDLGIDMTPHGGFYGETAVTYDNVFITLKSLNREIKTPADLEGLSVVSFQGAAARYPEWLAKLQTNGKYTELSDQNLQVQLLMSGRYDTILSDKNIFKYFLIKARDNPNFKEQAYIEHHFTVVNPKNYRPVFNSAALRDDFNIGLRKIKKNGLLKAIFDKYLSEKN